MLGTHAEYQSEHDGISSVQNGNFTALVTLTQTFMTKYI